MCCLEEFSEQAADYAKYRPRYPTTLFAYLASIAPTRELAWDCGTGNGQAAIGLAEYFRQVIATDANKNQIANAFPRENITYYVSPVEQTDIDSQSVDVITVAQVLHWLDLRTFYDEVERVLRPGGIFAAWYYYRCEINSDIDQILQRYYDEVVGPYWAPQIDLLRSQYRSISIPFHELNSPSFIAEALWDLEATIGYLNSWSSTQKYIKVQGRHPVEEIRQDLTHAWGTPKCQRFVRWTLYLRIGRKSY